MAELRFAAESEDALDDASLPVQQDRVGEPAVVICRLHVPAANENGKRRAKLAHELAHLAAADVVGDSADIEIRAPQLAVERGPLRGIFSTRCAPGSPEDH